MARKLKTGKKKSFMDMISGSLSKSGKQASQHETPVPTPELYTEQELEIVENHIMSKIGNYKNVFHEIYSPDIHCDVCVIDPTPERNFYTLVTLGMGAHKMNVPEEFLKYNISRAELAICVGADWDINSSDEKFYWPIRLIKSLARFPGECNTWLGYGHTIDNQGPYAENTKLCCSILSAIQSDKDGAGSCVLPNGDEVNFYQVIPIYPEERDFKIENSADELFDHFEADTYIMKPDRKCLITEEIAKKTWLRKNTIDSYYFHNWKVKEKNLATDEINACNHIAIFLRWSIKHGLVSQQFKETFPDIVSDVMTGSRKTDLREFIIENFDGRLYSFMLEEEGDRFAWYYYGRGCDPSYTSDIDAYAVGYFGLPRYHSNEFCDEAYLFVPYDEEYYNSMAKRIDRVYEYFRENIKGFQQSAQKENYNDYEYTAELIGLFEESGFHSLEEIESKSAAELESVFAQARKLQDKYGISDARLADILHNSF